MDESIIDVGSEAARQFVLGRFGLRRFGLRRSGEWRIRVLFRLEYGNCLRRIEVWQKAGRLKCPAIFPRYLFTPFLRAVPPIPHFISSLHVISSGHLLTRRASTIGHCFLVSPFSAGWIDNRGKIAPMSTCMCAVSSLGKPTIVKHTASTTNSNPPPPPAPTYSFCAHVIAGLLRSAYDPAEFARHGSASACMCLDFVMTPPCGCSGAAVFLTVRGL